MADKRFSDLTVATSIADTDLLAISQSGVSKQALGSVIKTYASTAPAIVGGTINSASIGATTAGTGAFTTLSASSTVSGAGFTTYLASPPAIGGTAPAAGTFTTLTATGNGIFDASAGSIKITQGLTKGATNTAVGFTSNLATNTGSNNCVFGVGLGVNTTGCDSVAIGSPALASQTTGGSGGSSNANVAIGAYALNTATTYVATFGAITGGSGYVNGTYAGVQLTYLSGSTVATGGAYPTANITVSGGVVTAVTLVSAGSRFIDTTTVMTCPNTSLGGSGSGFSIPVATLSYANGNVAVGYGALWVNQTGSSNTVIGNRAAVSMTTGSSNTIIGNNAYFLGTGGSGNIAIGVNALRNCTGSNNSGYGNNSGQSITTGSNNVILGSYTGSGAPISSTGSGYVILSDAFGAVRGTFDASGNFGIGASPSNAAAKLEVLGTYTACRSTGTTSFSSVWAYSNDFWSTPSYRGVGIQNNDSAVTGTTLGLANASLGQLIFQNTSNALIYTNGNTPLIFGTASVERARIDVSGNLCVGTTSASSRLTIVAAGQNALDASSVVTALPATLGAGQTVAFGLATPLTGSTFSATDPRYLTFGIDPVSGSYIRGHALNTYASTSTTIASGTYTAFTNGGPERARIDASGNLLLTSTGGLGYGTGSGGAVTQATSRTTGVTLNKTNGAITLVSAAGSTAWQSFTVTNSAVAATDVVQVSQKSGTDLYEIHVTAVAAGSFRISFKTTGGTTTEQPVFNFAIIKAVTA